MNSISLSEDKSQLKKDKEDQHELTHSNKIKNYISSRRTTNDSLLKQEGSNIRYRYKRHSLPSDINILNIDIIKIIDKIKEDIEEIKSDLKFKSNKKWNLNDELKENLISVRKEISRENLPLNKIKNILEHDIQLFIELLIELLENISDDNLELEILWILNNLIYFAAKYNDISLDSIKISNQIAKYYLTKVNNENEFKYSLFEKIYRIFGNLLFINNKSIYSLINNNIISNIIECLIRPVASFRLASLWILNKILIALKVNEEINNYINLFIDKYAIYNYNFIFERINNNIIDKIFY